ncbi:MAG: Uma2 family endonuclease, partial [Gammaproteobacteria bacterium]
MSTVIQRHTWSREEYERMVTAGVFHAEARLELIDGEIVNMVPQGSPHATAVLLLDNELRNICEGGFHVRVQMPLALDDSSEPEPDLAIVSGNPRDYSRAHPGSAALVVEISDTTLSYDRNTKKRLYARNG